MKALLFPLALCVAVSTASVPEAQSVKDGSVWRGGGVTIAMDIGFTGTEGVVTAQAISASGWSNTTNGTAGENHSDEHASCEDSGVMTVPTEEGSMQVKCENGRMKRKDGDVWRPMFRQWGSAVPPSLRNSQTLQQGHLAPWSGILVAPAPDGRTVMIQQGEAAPFTGLLCPGEETTSLPLN